MTDKKGYERIDKMGVNHSDLVFEDMDKVDFGTLQKWYQGTTGAATVDAKMSDVFPVDLSKRHPIWASNNAYTAEATADRESALLMYVPFDRVHATQEFINWDKVARYRDDPTASGFTPTVHQHGDVYYLQDGHHRAVASKLEGNPGMTMAVRVIEPEVVAVPVHVVQQPRAATGKFTSDPGAGFMSGNMAPGIPGVKAKKQAVIKEV